MILFTQVAICSEVCNDRISMSMAAIDSEGRMWGRYWNEAAGWGQWDMVTPPDEPEKTE